jgi:serine/threonine protein kinase
MEDDNSSTQQEMLEEKIIIEYEIIKKLGSGAYGHVWKVKHRSTNQIYAIKKIFLAFQNKVDAQRIYREISILHKLNHENIVKLNKIIHSEKQTDIYLVFECL